MEPIDFNGIDATVHGPLRLGVLTVLQMDGQQNFTTLKKRLQVSDGAIAPHLRKLEEEGYVSCKKSFVGRRPMSTYRITSRGRKAFANHLEKMERLITALKQ